MTEIGTALVTGASSGIGKEFACQLASRGFNLCLVARRETLLDSLAKEINSRYGMTALPLVADLSSAAGIEKVESWILSHPGLSMLVNNAGFGAVGNFDKEEINSHLEMIAVHVQATVRLTHASIPGMIARRQGAIINVSSISAIMPLGGNATYGATKAYLNSFSRTLAFELKGSGIKVQALCPGFTHTGFHDTPAFDGTDFRARIPKFMWMDAGRVVRQSLRGLQHNKVIVVPGLKNQLIYFAGQSGIILPLSGLIEKYRNRRV
jgi:short-subunit dehydrogenase